MIGCETKTDRYNERKNSTTHICIHLFSKIYRFRYVCLPLKNSSESSKTRLTRSSYPRSVPCSSRPPKHLTLTVASISLASSRMDSFFGGPLVFLLKTVLLMVLSGM